MGRMFPEFWWLVILTFFFPLSPKSRFGGIIAWHFLWKFLTWLINSLMTQWGWEHEILLRLDSWFLSGSFSLHCKTNASANHRDMAGAHCRQKGSVSLLLRHAWGPEAPLIVGGWTMMKHHFLVASRSVPPAESTSPPTRPFLCICLASSQGQTFLGN